MEIERKWLIDKDSVPYDLNNYEYWNIDQAYISFSPTIRIRAISNKNEYILTIKSPSRDNGLSREEYEINITKDQYQKLLGKKEGIILSKTRYRVKEDNHILEIDFFHNELEGLAYMEIEFDSIEQAKAYQTPSWVKQELTGNKHFSNASLAKDYQSVLEEFM